MLAEVRRQKILDYIREKTAVTTSELCDIFKVSRMTIRRDLKYLEEKGYIRATYNGAILELPNVELSFAEKYSTQQDEKREIANKAFEFLMDNDFIAISGGTTTFALVEKIVESNLKNLRVITNSLNVAMKLTEKQDIELIIIGGKVREKSYECIGHEAVGFLEKYNISKLFMGIDGISEKFGFSMASCEEAAVARAFVNKSVETYVLADHTKFGKVFPGYVCGLKEIKAVITDSSVSPKLIEKYEKSGLNFIFAKP
ncbi:MAG: DeoR family transcriptional regulator, fructose operon transcriptional repressor [Thermotogaceae bacterium]|nr:DeoR family transcriptional regulator, fructose operon transcriptional repressor [Thermotogaceae bacterium]MDN5336954.1 DeoR family transcriptional regulator, fructose operon transcriptional repressor [Thermotogaceae bacterium]